MRIGIFNPYLDGLTGGEKYMLTIASCLSENHEVFVFWDDQKIIDRASVKFGLDLSKVQLTTNIFSSKFSLIKRLLASKKYDATITLSDGSIPLLLSRKQFIHFQFPVEWVNGQSFKTKLKIKRINTVICNSNFTKKYIDKKFHINSTILYPPVDNKTTKEKKENIILNVGRFGRTIEGANYKKQDVMIDMFKKMVDMGQKKWKLVLVVSLREEDKGRFNDLKNATKGYPVEFIVNPDNKDLWKIYSQSKIYWHASGYGEDLINHPEYAEHFGISTVEAMSAGAVPVVINAGGQPEIVQDGENGFLWDSLEELVNKTKKVIDSDKLWTRLSERAQKKVELFNQKRFCKEISEIIKNG